MFEVHRTKPVPVMKLRIETTHVPKLRTLSGIARLSRCCLKRHTFCESTLLAIEICAGAQHVPKICS